MQILWGIFLSIVIILMILDLGVFNKKDEIICLKKSLMLTGFYIAVALLFGVFVYLTLGPQKMTEYYTGYLVEKSLSLDNLFVMSVIFASLNVPKMYQHRVLFWGILGVIILRAILIGFGAVLVSSFSWMLYLFGGFLILMGFKMIFVKEKNEVEMTENFLMKFLRKHCRLSSDLHGHDFYYRAPTPKNASKKVIYFTPLFVALILIEGADIIFALDSIPAIFVITTDPFIVYTSNIFAILGLRSLYFALEAILQKFVYLKYALSFILIFIGSKVFVTDFMGWAKFPPSLSLGITAGALTLGILFSLWKTNHGHSKKN